MTQRPNPSDSVDYQSEICAQIIDKMHETIDKQDVGRYRKWRMHRRLSRRRVREAICDEALAEMQAEGILCYDCAKGEFDMDWDGFAAAVERILTALIPLLQLFI